MDGPDLLEKRFPTQSSNRCFQGFPQSFAQVSPQLVAPKPPGSLQPGFSVSSGGVCVALGLGVRLVSNGASNVSALMTLSSTVQLFLYLNMSPQGLNLSDASLCILGWASSNQCIKLPWRLVDPNLQVGFVRFLYQVGVVKFLQS